MVHATLDPADLHKDVPVDYALVGDAKLTLCSLISEIRQILHNEPRGRAEPTAQQIATIKEKWLAQWQTKLTSNETPLSP